MTKELDISNFILIQSEKELCNEKDLIFSYEQFLISEEYEKCSIVDSLIKNKKFDNQKGSWSVTYLDIQNEINEIKKLINHCENYSFDDELLRAQNLLIQIEKNEKQFIEIIKKRLLIKFLKEKL